jgi:hypothetical protein
MIGLRTKREEKYPSANLEDLIALLNLAIKSSLWRETNRAKMIETLPLLELLKTVIQEKLDSQGK